MRRAVVTVCIVSTGGGQLVRTFPLTPYDMEVVADDVRRRGSSARLELSVDGSDRALAEVEHALATVAPGGVRVSVDRAHGTRARAKSKGDDRCSTDVIT